METTWLSLETAERSQRGRETLVPWLFFFSTTEAPLHRPSAVDLLRAILRPTDVLWATGRARRSTCDERRHSEPLGFNTEHRKAQPVLGKPRGAGRNTHGGRAPVEKALEFAPSPANVDVLKLVSSAWLCESCEAPLPSQLYSWE